MQALSISTAAELESLVTTAIYSSLIVARLSPATTPPTVNVTAVAPLRDVPSQTVSAMISILSEWEGRCGSIINGIEAEIAKIKDQTIKNGILDRQRKLALEKAIADEDGESNETAGGLRGKNVKHSIRPGKAGFKSGGGPAIGGNSNKREYSGDDLEEEDDGYFENGSDGGLDTYGSRMEIDEGPSRAASSAASRQTKRILGVGRKT